MNDVSNRFLSFETIISFTTLIVIFAFGYGGLSTQVTALAGDIEEVNTKHLPEKVARVEVELQAVVKTVDEAKEQMNAINEKLDKHIAQEVAQTVMLKAILDKVDE